MLWRCFCLIGIDYCAGFVYQVSVLHREYLELETRERGTAFISGDLLIF